MPLGDRWLPDYDADSSAALELFDRHFARIEKGAPDVRMPELTTPDAR